jgi:uncharacterized protein
LRCLLPADTAAARLARRVASGEDASDATTNIATAMADEFDSWPNAVDIDTMPPVSAILHDVLDRIGATHVKPAVPGDGL